MAKKIFVSQSSLRMGRNRPHRDLERTLDKEIGVGKIAFPVLDLAECPKKERETYGHYYKYYFDNMYLQCKIYGVK